jgi:hypothetical protein
VSTTSRDIAVYRLVSPIAQGIIAEDEFDLDALERRMREEAMAANSCIPAPAMVAAFTRLRA